MGYVGQPPAPTDITDVGTIVTGTWQATDLAVSHGGTGVSTLTDDGVLIGSAAGVVRATDAGTAGEILTSGGVGVAPDWAAAAGAGGTYDFVASGAIANGDMVKLNTDGTVTVTTALASPVQGSTVNTGAGTVNSSSAVYDPSTNRVVVFTEDDASTMDYIVGTVSGTTISLGTATAFTGTWALDPSACYDPDTERILVLWNEGGSSSSATSRAKVFQVNGGSTNTLTGGSTISNWTSTAYYNSKGGGALTYDTTANKFVAAYMRDSNGSGLARVITVTGGSTNTASFGTEYVWHSSDYAEGVGCGYDSTTDRTLFVTGDEAYVGTVSGTTLSFGSAVSHAFNYPSQTNYSKVRCNAVTGNMIVADSNRVVVGAITGGATNTSSWGSTYSTGISRPGLEVNSASGQFIVSGAASNTYGHQTSGSGHTLIFEITGTNTINLLNSYTESNLFETSSVAYDSTNQKMAVAWTINYGQSQVRIYDTGSPDVSGWVGAATAAISDTATGTISVLGGINESQTSLTVGSKYYIQNGGTIATTVVSGQEVGRALSATNLLITSGGIS